MAEVVVYADQVFAALDPTSSVPNSRNWFSQRGNAESVGEIVALSFDYGESFIRKGDPGFEEALQSMLAPVQNEPPVDDGSTT